MLGNGIAPIALAFGVLSMPGGGATDLGLVLLARELTQVIFLLLGRVSYWAAEPQDDAA